MDNPTSVTPEILAVGILMYWGFFAAYISLAVWFENRGKDHGI